MTMSQKVLVVEDDTALSDAFSIVLRNAGYDVSLAHDGKEALELTAKNRYAIILLDLLMPIMDGKEFLRQFENKSDVPIIVFSNLDAKDDIDEALQLGATRYMLKSWASPQKLTELIKETIGSAG